MTPEEAIRKHDNLRRHCEARNIPFSLTLKDWVDAWGDKIAERGALQLQRIEKSKGFVVGNLTLAPPPQKASK
jgi:hypothetical protein